MAAAGSEEIAWIWPASGKLIGTFSEGGNKGIDINGKAGDACLLPAAARSCIAAPACAATASW
jgi:lipoprotein NlpD